MMIGKTVIARFMAAAGIGLLCFAPANAQIAADSPAINQTPAQPQLQELP